MLDFLLMKLAGVPWYFWSLALAWGGIEAAGWARVRNSRKRRSGSNGGRPWVRSLRLGLRRRVY